ncbi:hypothetical protein BWD14_04955 [Leptospira santarosai]|uniref:Uncharacterized protein n=1 Tax=Leptospira santarosai TaxID=28183 RepID=A0AB73MBK2_9LEPT|nr:hypothetical protein BWD14_04955 [Leptospira santarosai]
MIRILSRISPKVKATKAKYIFWEKISILIQNRVLTRVRCKKIGVCPNVELPRNPSVVARCFVVREFIVKKSVKRRNLWELPRFQVLNLK